MPQLITRGADLDAFVDRALQGERYAIDTEFHRERTYYPQVALVQIALEDEIVLIDPLQVDLGSLRPLLESEAMCVAHAAAQDLEVLERACGTAPANLFDTQIAAGFLGLSSASLATLVRKYEGVQLTKGDRLTDWLRRPLTDDQVRYAAADVEYLLGVTDKLVAGLAERGRMGWVEDECQRLLDTALRKRSPLDSLRRIKEARSMKGASLAVALELVIWREERAARIDVPVRSVLSDIALVGVAQRAPTTEKGLREIRGVDARHLRGEGVIGEILATVARGSRATPPSPLRNRDADLERSLRPVISLVTSWVSQVARDYDLDPAALATRGDVEAFLADRSDSRLDRGWRNELVGAPIRALVRGKAALAFDGSGGLVLEHRSGKLFGRLESPD